MCQRELGDLVPKHEHHWLTQGHQTIELPVRGSCNRVVELLRLGDLNRRQRDIDFRCDRFNLVAICGVQPESGVHKEPDR